MSLSSAPDIIAPAASDAVISAPVFFACILFKVSRLISLFSEYRSMHCPPIIPDIPEDLQIISNALMYSSLGFLTIISAIVSIAWFKSASPARTA